MTGKWYAFLTVKRAVKVAEYAAPQPWGYPTPEAALKAFRPSVQLQENARRKEADELAAALDAIDVMLEEES